MAQFELNGRKLYVPDEILTPSIRRMFEKGWYEIEEFKAIKAHLVGTDSVLELGSGVGYLATICSDIVGSEQVTTVEANPDMIPIIQHNLGVAGHSNTKVINGVAVETQRGETEEFYVPPAFWASSRKKREGTGHKQVSVPSFALRTLIDEVSPTVLIVDVEGAEDEFFFFDLPSELRLVIIELHPVHYPQSAINALFLRLLGQGFGYEVNGSHGAVVVFKRN